MKKHFSELPLYSVTKALERQLLAKLGETDLELERIETIGEHGQDPDCLRLKTQLFDLTGIFEGLNSLDNSGSFMMPIHEFRVLVKTSASQAELQEQAQDALKRFAETRDTDHFVRYKQLIGELRAMLMDILLKIGRLHSQLCGPAATLLFIDLRRQVRKLTKMFSLNTDDENAVVNNSFWSLLLINHHFSNHEHQSYFRHYQGPGVLSAGYLQ